MHSKNTGIAKFTLQRQIEIWSINTYKNRRSLTKQRLPHTLANVQQLLDPAKHFNHTHNRQTLHRKQGFEALSEHFRTPDPDKTGIGIEDF